ncbi:hypothetical protein ACIQ1H_17905 [Lysinibacillus sp. NPDC097279]
MKFVEGVLYLLNTTIIGLADLLHNMENALLQESNKDWTIGIVII